MKNNRLLEVGLIVIGIVILMGAIITLIPLGNISTPAAQVEAVNIATFLHERWRSLLMILSLLLLLVISVVLLIRSTRNKKQNDLLRSDPLTGLPNFKAFCEEAGTTVQEHSNDAYMICRINLQDFRRYNRIYGLQRGDVLLKDFAEQLRKTYLEKDPGALFTRVGVDHFLIFAARAVLFDTEKVYEQVRSILAGLVPNYFLDVHIGFCEVPLGGDAIAKYSEHALEALYSLQEMPQAHCAWYDVSLQLKLREEERISNSMHYALKNGQFIPFFQPQIDYFTGKMSGAEVLVRWKHPDKGLISPDRFIPLFEKNGFIYEVDQSVWRQSCAMLKKWRGEGISLPHISVNVSRYDFGFADLPDVLLSIVKEAGLTVKDVHLEITESAFVDKPQSFVHMVRSLHEAGFVIEMDDFGSGYSSLNLLKEMPFDVLKLDMALSQENDQTGKAGNILSSIIHMAHHINMNVIAEGVEKTEQAEFLKSIGCRYMQGYLFAKPLPPDQFVRQLAEQGSAQAVERSETMVASRFLDMRTQEAMLFNSFVSGACILVYRDEKLQCVRANDRFFEVMELSRETGIQNNKDLFAYMDAADAEAFREALKKAMDSHREAGVESCFNNPQNGRKIWQYTQFRFLGMNADEAFFYVTVENITRRKELEEHDRELNHMLTSLLDNLPGGLTGIKKNEDGFYFTYMNENFARLRGYTHEEMMALTGEQAYCCVFPEDRAMVEQTFLKVWQEKQSSSIHYRVLHKDGHVLHVRMKCYYDENFQAIVAFYADASEHLPSE